MLHISQRLFQEWNDSNLLYCHWKSNEHLMAGLDGRTDLDVLLSSDMKKDGEKILKSLDFLKCKSQYGSRYPGVDDWIGYDEETGSQIHLHLHYHLITGHKGMKEYTLPWTEEALNTRIKDTSTGVYVMHPDLEIVTLLTRIALKVGIKDFVKRLLGRYKLSKDSLNEIIWLKDRIDLRNVESLAKQYYHKKYDILLSIIEKDKILSSDVFRLRKVAERVFETNNRVGVFNRFVEFYYVFLYRFYSKVNRKIKGYTITRKTPYCGKGLTIAFLGQDGAGKTTVTSDLLKWLNWKLDVRYTYLGSGDNYKSWRKTMLDVLPNNIVFRFPRVLLILTKYTALASDVIKYIKSGEEYAKNGGIQIFDRYPQVQYMGISDGPKLRVNILKKLPSSVRRLFTFMADLEENRLAKVANHQPDIVFKLLIPPAESVRRKPENNLETMVQKHNIIKSLNVGNNTKTYEIDATMPYEKEILIIKTIVWNNLKKD